MQDYFTIKDGPKSPKTSELMDTMRSKFKVWSWYDDKELDKQFPVPKKSTTRYFLKTQEADEDLKNKSANDLEKEEIPTCTLRERLMMEIQYWNETGKNLDVDNITLCTGSRLADGGVPCVDRRGGGSVGVYGCVVRCSDPNLRARRAVSLEPGSLRTLVEPTIEAAIAQIKAAGYVVYKSNSAI